MEQVKGLNLKIKEAHDYRKAQILRNSSLNENQWCLMVQVQSWNLWVKKWNVNKKKEAEIQVVLESSAHSFWKQELSAIECNYRRLKRLQHTLKLIWFIQGLLWWQRKVAPDKKIPSFAGVKQRVDRINQNTHRLRDVTSPSVILSLYYNSNNNNHTIFFFWGSLMYLVLFTHDLPSQHFYEKIITLRYV